MKLPIIDSHAHVYGESYADDLPEVIERAERAGVVKILLCNVDEESYPEIMKAVEEHPEILLPMIGLHPTNLKTDYKRQLEWIYGRLMSEPERFVGIGEIGLDYYWSTEQKVEQNEVLRAQLTWARERGLPVSLHTRDAVEDTIVAIREVGEKGLRGVFHSFTGSREELEKILELEHFSVGINGVVTFKNSDLATVLKGVLPLNRLLVETDSPYLSPTPHRGKRNEPARLIHILEKLAEVYERPVEEVAKEVYLNTLQMYSIS
ncbi:MAG: TatD family hydrolase [Porphyromonas sp.]|nr:TatD family hydrolase [Porphyromonas sp.]